MTERYLADTVLDRRRFLGAAAAGGAALALPACTTTEMGVGPGPAGPAPGGGLVSMYAPVTDGGHQLPAIPVDRMNPGLLRQMVDDPTGEAPGTIVVDTSAHHLYAVQPGGKAMRYGVSLGKAGFGWSGTAVIQWKKRWPVWTPPPEMIERRPDLARYGGANGGMPAGPQNPLGARALYIFRDGRDTMYRLHGTPEWSSIGKNASSGCVRLLNQDVIDLYDRVTGRVPIIVRASAGRRDQAVSLASARATTQAIDAGVPRDAELLN